MNKDHFVGVRDETPSLFLPGTTTQCDSRALTGDIESALGGLPADRVSPDTGIDLPSDPITILHDLLRYRQHRRESSSLKRFDSFQYAFPI
jgi:hypothetical protein